MTPAQFAEKWLASERRERASSQEHFIDLCRMLGFSTPNDPGSTPDWYAFEKGAEKTDGRDGFADVWRRACFAWEYKGAHKDLGAAYGQLLEYREALENPPILVVSDMDRIIIRTNFNNTKTRVWEFTLADLRDAPAEALRVLRLIFTSPEALRPDRSPEVVTKAAADHFASIARSMSERGHEPLAVAHFLNRVLFCLFAEDVGLLPTGLMTELVRNRAASPVELNEGLRELFGKMSVAGPDRHFGTHRIAWFNGGLFDGAPVIPFTREEIVSVREAANLDWSQVEPAILGTLFERGLDPAKRGQLGAHYTDRAKIDMVVDPVVMTPLLREFEAMKERVDALMAGRTPSPLTREGTRRANLPTWEREAEAAWRTFLARLRAVRVLDPACGSGNFLYVTLRKLKDLEQQALQWGSERLRLTGDFPDVGPQNVLGIEINPYAKELAGVSIWIGHIQWMLENGYAFPNDPVLRPLDNIELRDAILARDDRGRPVPAEWPAADFIVGNPPFLGGNFIRAGLGDAYVEALFETWSDQVPPFSDLVCYWHEKAREQIDTGKSKRAGLLATNSIRGGVNRRVLERIKETGDIFMAWSDEPWIVEGAAVRVSIIGQDAGVEANAALNGRLVGEINPDLTASADLTKAAQLIENTGVCFMGPSPKGPFDITRDIAEDMLRTHGNPNGRPNSDVVRPVVSGTDLVRRSRDLWTIDFGLKTEQSAAQYEKPFEYAKAHVFPVRTANRRSSYAQNWWRYAEPRPGLRAAVSSLPRHLVTPALAKHRVFVWLVTDYLCNQQTLVVAREDDYAFGVLHSRVHERWSLRTGTSLEDRPRYTPTTTFETFPFPWPLNTPDAALTPEQAAHRDAIGAAAKALDEARSRWLNPPELVREEPDVVPSLPPRLIPVDEDAAKELAKRTLTNLYNARPAWLANLHADLDRAVLAAYGWPEEIEEEPMLAALLALNLERAAGQG
ncbi:MAG: class I SAM-dependent DNA methyltransferase [Chloroflexi bacterium HGW-Chloroflexi-9]|nr:MAG: class I SAM-dependent DNA methyltransferase [Chloroflexi bacterium HGW-Chloroflexi-9]